MVVKGEGELEGPQKINEMKGGFHWSEENVLDLQTQGGKRHGVWEWWATFCIEWTKHHKVCVQHSLVSSAMVAKEQI